MELIRSNQAEMQVNGGFTTTLLGKVVFESEDVESRLIEDPNLRGDEEFVKLVVNTGMEDHLVGSTLTVIRKETDGETGVERTKHYTYPISVDNLGAVIIASDYYLEDISLVTLVPFMSEWLQDLLRLAQENLQLSMSASTSESISHSLSTSESLSLSESTSNSLSLSESLVHSQSHSFSVMTSNSLDEYNSQLVQSMSEHRESLQNSMMGSLSNLESEAFRSTSESLSLVQASVSMDLDEVLNSVSNTVENHYKQIESLAIKFEPLRLSYELGEVSTGDLVTQMGEIVDLESVKEELTEIIEQNLSAEEMQSEVTAVLEAPDITEFGRTGDWLEDEEFSVQNVDNSKSKKVGFFKRLFKRKDKQYKQLVSEVVEDQINAVQQPANVGMVDEIQIVGGSYKIELPRK
mgnify:FL=1